MRRILLLVIVLLYVASVPWYRAADADPPLLLGLPSWAAVALLCYSAIACLNAAAWFSTDFEDPSDGPPEGGDR